MGDFLHVQLNERLSMPPAIEQGPQPAQCENLSQSAQWSAQYCQASLLRSKHACCHTLRCRGFVLPAVLLLCYSRIPQAIYMLDLWPEVAAVPKHWCGMFKDSLGSTQPPDLDTAQGPATCILPKAHNVVSSYLLLHQKLCC
jgi:hypothetical protein